MAETPGTVLTNDDPKWRKEGPKPGQPVSLELLRRQDQVVGSARVGS